MLFNSLILFLNIYCNKIFTKIYLVTDNYKPNFINSNTNNNTNNLLSYNNIKDKGYYYDKRDNTYKENKFNGYDSRKNITEKGSIENIRIYFYKKSILDKLNNDKLSINTKMKYIEDYNKFFNNNNISSNIFAGGLMKNWDF
jgi:hypothetical protein